MLNLNTVPIINENKELINKLVVQLKLLVNNELLV